MNFKTYKRSVCDILPCALSCCLVLVSSERSQLHSAHMTEQLRGSRHRVTASLTCFSAHRLASVSQDVPPPLETLSVEWHSALE